MRGASSDITAPKGRARDPYFKQAAAILAGHTGAPVSLETTAEAGFRA